jgi:hypothetical protein
MPIRRADFSDRARRDVVIDADSKAGRFRSANR